MDGLSVSSHGLSRRLKHTQDRRSCLTVRIGFALLKHAVHEMRVTVSECFSRVQLRRPHVADPITDEHASNLFGIVCCINALVVYFNFIARFEIIINDHLAAAADNSSADFYRRKPIDIDMSNRVAGKRELR